MKMTPRLFVISLLTLSLHSCRGQVVENSNAVTKPIDNDSCTYFYDDNLGMVYTYVDTMPDYPGGMNALIMHFSKNFNYPQIDPKTETIQGRVTVKFIIDSTGELTNTHVTPSGNRTENTSIEKEAIRVFQTLPNRWIPGKCHGKNVAVEIHFPIGCIKPDY